MKRQRDAARTGMARKPIQRGVLLSSLLFVALLCALLWGLSYQIFASTLYSSYNNRLRSVITYVENNADADDLARCLRTGDRKNTRRCSAS